MSQVINNLEIFPLKEYKDQALHCNCWIHLVVWVWSLSS